MYRVTYNLYDRVGTWIGGSSDEVLDLLSDFLGSNFSFENEVYDLRYKASSPPYQFERYEETADIIDDRNKKVGRYWITKV